MKYNLRLSVAALLLFLAVGPLLYGLFKPVTKVRIHDYSAEITACALTLPFLLLLSFSTRFARFCARDPACSTETAATARYTSCIVFVLLILAIIGEYAL